MHRRSPGTEFPLSIQRFILLSADHSLSDVVKAPRFLSALQAASAARSADARVRGRQVLSILDTVDNIGLTTAD